MKRFLIVISAAVLLLSLSVGFLYGAQKKKVKGEKGKPYAGTTLNILMEDVPDTNSIEPLLSQFESETGIKVVFEKVVYTVMHEKLIPQLMAGEGNGTYDILEVDNYWVGEFVMAGWLRPIDNYLKKTPQIKMADYIDAVVDMFTVGDKAYFIPMWTYPFGLVYRADVVNDPKFRSFYEKKTGKKWAFPPKDLYEYAEMAKAAKAFVPKGMYGCAMQGAKVDPLVMELTNYVYALGGDYYDRSEWKASYDSKVGREALKIYKDLIDNAAQPGANGANFDDAFNTFGQGKAVFAVTHNFLMPWLLDKTNSVVFDKVEFVPLPGGGLLGGWAWAIPVSSPNPDAGWEFIKFVERKENQKARGMGGGMPCAKWVYEEQDFLNKYKFQRSAGVVIANAKALPIVSQSTRMVEIVGENSSRALIGELSIDEALRNANAELNEIIEGDPLVEMQKKKK
jgi:ABC-type glycerol-3-phosphate transport system substrate-binding protein